jgi:4-hydroxy-2-oxoglutarate aldolase
LRGILLPFATRFDEWESIDTQGIQSNIKRWNTTGIAGYAALGSTGERVHLDEREYVEAIETARAVVPIGPDGLAFIVGAGQQSTRGTINEVEKAADAGADAVLVITPHYYRPSITQDALIAHYTSVADAAPVPLILYSMPALTGIKIEPETVARLSQHPNIIGVKDSSADLGGLKETIRLVRDSSKTSPEEFAILTGNGTVLFEALCAGADGAILAVGCVAPRLCIEIFKAVKANEHERAKALQEKLTPLARAVTTTYGIGGLKAALDMIGYAGGAVRAPLRAPDEAGRQEIARVLAEANAILANEKSHQTNDPDNTTPQTTELTPEEGSSLVQPASRA